jgi:hypothetical protein
MNLQIVETANLASTPQVLGLKRREVDTYRAVVQTEDDSYKAYVKCLYGRELVNELIVATLGRTFGYPIPRPFLIQAQAKDFPVSKAVSGFDPDEFIYVFGSKDVGYPSYTRFFEDDEETVEYVLRHRKFKKWAETIIFDEWVANTDRHIDNLLLASEDEALWIDHARSFTGEFWEAEDLKEGELYKNKLADRLWPKLSIEERMGLKSRSEEMAQWFCLLPYHQVLACSRVSPFLNSTDAAALMTFIEKRVGLLESIICIRLGVPKIGL